MWAFRRIHQKLTFVSMMRKLLVIRFSSIGDIVLTTPVVRCLAQQYPESEIHYLTKPTFASMLHSNPYVTKVHVLKDDLNSVVQELKSEAFDYVIDLHHNIRSMRVRSALGVDGKAFPKLNIQKWLLVNFKWNRMPDIHLVHRYFQAASALGLKYDGMGLDYFIPEKDMVSIDQLPEAHRSGYLAIAIGAQHYTKRMPVERLKQLVEKLSLPVVLLGGKEDFEHGELIRDGNSDYVFNACGSYNLNQSASLLQQSRLLITHDTGLMHIGAALRKPIISIWGSTVPAFGMIPFLPDGMAASTIIENTELHCRPCSKLGFHRCPKQHFKCMNEIDLMDVRKQVEAILDK